MPRPRSDIAPRVVESARRLFLRHGVEGASLRRIADAAGTNIGMIYYYFPTKDDLFIAVVEDVYRGMVEDIAESIRSSPDLEHRLRTISARLGRLSDAEFDVLRLVIREVLVSSERLHDIVERFRRGHVPLFLDMLRDGVKQGELSSRTPLPILAAATAAILMLPQLVRRRLQNDEPELATVLPSAEAMADALVGVLLGGVGGA